MTLRENTAMKVKQNLFIKTQVTHVIVAKAVIKILYKKMLPVMERFCTIFRKYSNIYIHRNCRDLQNA